MSGARLGNNYEICVPRMDTAKNASLSKWDLQTAACRLLPDDRIRACHRIMSDSTRGVSVKSDGKKAWYGGLAVCGSVWLCNVCARRIGERRREELQAAINKAIGQGMDVALITFTFSHALYHRIDDVLPKLTKALRYLKAGRKWQALKEKYGIVGSVRALEVTHGLNGWHPHVHEIEFFKYPLGADTREQMQNEIFELWYAACQKAQLGLPNREHGVDVRGATRAAQYVGKWGFAAELTRGTGKTGWAGRTPWELLGDFHGGDKTAGDLFLNFADAFRGRRQLFWSKGLRDLLEMGELFSDEQLAESEPEGDDALEVAELDRDDWADICRCEARAHVLHLALEDRPGLMAWLDRLRSARKNLDPQKRARALSRVTVLPEQWLLNDRPATSVKKLPDEFFTSDEYLQMVEDVRRLQGFESKF